MKSTLAALLLTAVIALNISSAQAGPWHPYKIEKVSCRGSEQTLELKWDFSKALFVHEILVNGTNHVGGSAMASEPGSHATTYSKDGIFEIQLGNEDHSKPFLKQVKIGGKPFELTCTHSQSWKWQPLSN